MNKKLHGLRLDQTVESEFFPCKSQTPLMQIGTESYLQLSDSSIFSLIRLVYTFLGKRSRLASDDETPSRVSPYSRDFATPP